MTEVYGKRQTKCSRCDVDYVPGIMYSLSRVKDVPIKCMKCPNCGESMPMTDEEKEKYAGWYKRVNESVYKDTDIRVIDQRIGMGIGGLDTVIRLHHKLTGILIEMTRLTRQQYNDRELAFDMLKLALERIETFKEKEVV